MARRKRVVYETPAEKKRRLEAKRARRAAAPPAVPQQTASSARPATNDQETTTPATGGPMSHFHAHPEVFRPREKLSLLQGPVELHKKILKRLLTTPDGDNGLFGDWWEPYMVKDVNADMEERTEQQRRFFQRTRHYRDLWNQQNGVPPAMRGYLEVSPFAREVWEAHAHSLIRKAMQALADKLGLGPGKPVEKVKCMEGLLEWNLKEPLGLKVPGNLNIYTYLDGLAGQRDMTDLLYLQEWQYNRVMSGRDRAGRPEVTEDPISPNQPLNKLPADKVHARILFHLFNSRRSHYYDIYAVDGTPYDRPRLPYTLRIYLEANPTAEKIWNAQALSILDESFKFVRRRLELAWQELNAPIPYSVSLDAERDSREEYIRGWQREWRYLEVWRRHLEAARMEDEDQSKESDDEEEQAELAALFRNPSLYFSGYVLYGS
jgi:hypothetical protein